MTNPFPVRFSLMVNGKRQGAYLETILNAGTYNVFSIGFADGYQDCFFDKGDGNIRGINEQKSKPYASALKHDLHVFDHLIGNATLENFPYQVDGQFANGWILKKQSTTGLQFAIYLKGQHQFDIIEKEKGWTAVASEGIHRPIDTKLANYAFNWANTPAPEKHEDEQPAPPLKPAKPVEFPFEFMFEGKTRTAKALLQDTRPWQQCFISIGTNLAEDFFQFFKINNKDQMFSWLPYSGKKEKMAKAISAALGERFSVEKIFASN